MHPDRPKAGEGLLLVFKGVSANYNCSQCCMGPYLLGKHDPWFIVFIRIYPANQLKQFISYNGLASLSTLV